MTILFRTAMIGDADMLMRWRNDPLTIANFRTNRAVSLIEHEHWLRNRLNNSDKGTFIAVDIDEEDDDAEPTNLGTVQLDKMENKENGYEVSVTVAPEQRGKGLGGQILKLVCDDYPESTLYTEVKYDNTASMKSFGAAGFVQIGSYGLWTQWRRMPLK
jgi:RimJ/RimL family protein N-acetyltransferase